MIFGLFKKPATEAGSEMSFLGHLEELRWHLIRAVIVIIAGGIYFFVQKEFLFDQVLLAPKEPSFITYKILCQWVDRYGLPEDICMTASSFKLISTDISAQFTTHMWSAFIGGLVIGFPYLIWELWRFVKPALKETEKKYATGVVFFTSSLFLLGIAFGYYVITPMSVNFLGSYQVSSQVENTITLDSFIGMVTTMTLITGIVFELPMVVYFLSKLGIMSPSMMRTYRRHAVVVIMILSAVITPTSDVTTLLLVAIPLYILYELSIFVSAFVVGKKSST